MAKQVKITSVLTGDIIKSRVIKNPNQWLTPLKKILSEKGPSPKVWEIYRGDGFQLEIENPADALLMAIKIKATIKRTKNLDVRMAIGIGPKTFAGKKITESNGEAFIMSGEKLESLKKEKQNLAIKSRWPEFDEEMNLLMRLASIPMDNWTPRAADLVQILVENQAATQKKLAKKLRVVQSSISERRKRAYYTEIMSVESFYRKKIKELFL